MENYQEFFSANYYLSISTNYTSALNFLHICTLALHKPGYKPTMWLIKSKHLTQIMHLCTRCPYFISLHSRLLITLPNTLIFKTGPKLLAEPLMDFHQLWSLIQVSSFVHNGNGLLFLAMFAISWLDFQTKNGIALKLSLILVQFYTLCNAPPISGS